MDKTNYRILKLKNGDSIIASMLPMSKKDIISLEEPMVFKTVSVLDEKNHGMREFLMIRNWAEYSTDKVVDIPTESIIAILSPDEKITNVYEFEKAKASISPEEIEQAMNDMQSKLTKEDNPNNFHTVNVELQLSPEASINFLDMLGIELENMESIDEEDLEDLDEEEDDLEDFEDFTPVKDKSKNKPPVEKKKPTWGNSFEDWSPDPNDYLK